MSEPIEADELIDPHAEETRINTPHGCGWTRDGSEITLDDGRVIAISATLLSELPVPKQVSNAQFRSALILVGIMPATVLASLQAISDETSRELALTKWEYANFIERNHPLIESMSSEFGLTAEQVDELFKKAETL